MLRISAERGADDVTCLRLEGRAVGAWVVELARSCEAVRASGGYLRLELAGTSFLGPEAVCLVKRLICEGVPVSGCSPFVREQLEGSCNDARKAG